MKNEPIIELKNICYAYGNQIALRYVNLEIQAGECMAIIGPNGCGKSTLLKIMNGLIHPNEGSFIFEGEEITEKKLNDAVFSKAFHQKIGYIFQNADTQLFCSNVYEEVAFAPSQMGLSEEEVKQRTEDVLKLLGIEHLRDRAPYHLSGGEKRKVAIACVLSANPSILMLDEPLAGLDKASSLWLIGFLQEIKAAGKTICLVTHDENLVEQLADRIYSLSES